MSDPVTRLNAALEGRYRIERQLGAGGMATVYLADDLRHERKVALKVLKPELAAVVGAERFLAEIKTTANLQHPHILPLHDSGQADGFLFYVMPFVEGESLRDRLDREHQLPVDEAVRFATAVAGALDYAHREGVIHRDIKPANILLQHGEPVVADFGIALAVGSAGGARLTETGLSVGTPHYMSPEQATGDLQVGPAADIYALGCVLFEMLVGEPPFTGSTPQAILGKIITGDTPSATRERHSVPEHVDAAVARALEKLPADRFATARDFGAALADPGFRHGRAAGAARAVSGGSGPWNRLSVALAGVSVVLAGALAFVSMGGSPTDPGAPFALPVDLPDGTSLVEEARPAAIAPDGRGIAYVAVSEAGRLLHYLPPDQIAAIPLPGTSGARFPFFSPDGEWIGFFARNTLWKVRATGGEVQSITVLVTAGMNGATWADNDTIYFARSGGRQGVMKVAASGGDFVQVSSPTEGGHWWPSALPGGGRLLVQHHTGFTPADERGISLLDPATGETRVLIDEGSGPVYSPSGHILYMLEDGSLMAAPFDADGLEVTGPPVRVAQGVDFTGSGGGSFSISPTGTLLYVQDAERTSASVVSVSRDGVESPIPGVDCFCAGPSYSPDGRRLVVQEAAGGGQALRISIIDLDSGERTAITVAGTSLMQPGWRPPAGTDVVFSTSDLRTRYLAPADGSGTLVEFIEPGVFLNMGAWTPDGRWYLYARQFPELAQVHLFMVDPEAGREPEALTSGAIDYAPQVSPDGRWLAYQSRATGRDEVWVMAFPDGGAPVQVTSEGGTSPLWAPDGRELFYRVGSAVWSVEVDLERGFRMGEHEELFDGPYGSGLFGAEYSVHPSGESFAMTRSGSWGGRLVLVQNFGEELKRLAPGD